MRRLDSYLESGTTCGTIQRCCPHRRRIGPFDVAPSLRRHNQDCLYGSLGFGYLLFCRADASNNCADPIRVSRPWLNGRDRFVEGVGISHPVAGPMGVGCLLRRSTASVDPASLVRCHGASSFGVQLQVEQRDSLRRLQGDDGSCQRAPEAGVRPSQFSCEFGR